MTAAKQNGLDAGHAEPAKSLTENAHEFIATCARLASATGIFVLSCVALLLQIAVLALGGQNG